ncbi:hypothetical protein FV232_00970 [Methylobacterium sp. WL30]|uniref:hypothetical protein n=1 Tax=unclassified Methylobacterium TaxID=2615210 RepID=UPI0011C99D44|nr:MULTISPECIES: hypothetical protein [unclassified Methylobacterium]TXN38973.1 hypothetical protein FV225_11630 [Methylobacterium sp. WL93]TXN52260.1 hypothetical protein FV227_04200 [Methylobacterium sp. WL119]TXN70657.1 hypothetical protein FV232_00970 [Methylobacterium sp. WL30]
MNEVVTLHHGQRETKKLNREAADLARSRWGRDLPVVQVMAAEMPRVVDEAEETLIEAGAPVFTRAGALVRPVSELLPSTSGQLARVAHLRPLCKASLADILGQTMRFQRWDERRQSFVNMDVPPVVAETMLARQGQWRLPPLAGIITTPTLRADGTLLSEPGYDPETRLFVMLDEGFTLGPLPERPTRADVEAALKLLLDLLSGFPFVGPVDRAVALSGIITSVLRPGLPTAPAHGIRAHTAGTGKSLMVDLFSAIALGRPCPVIAVGKTEEETEKRLGALLLNAVSVISIDNVNGELGGDLLCQMTERPLVRVRKLGTSEAPEIECRSMVFATGNNLVLVGDMTRRTVLCTLDAGVERPETREFEFDPIQRVIEDRGKYVAAALTIARAYRVAGFPKRCVPLGSYGVWSDTVRSALMWLGEADPAASMETMRDEDPELLEIRSLLAHWRDNLAEASFYTASQVIDTAIEKDTGGGFLRPEFRDLLLRIAGDGPVVSSKRLGRRLVKMHGRVVGQMRLDLRADEKRGNRFALSKIRVWDGTGEE